jgi:hypothetical protein
MGKQKAGCLRFWVSAVCCLRRWFVSVCLHAEGRLLCACVL